MINSNLNQALIHEVLSNARNGNIHYCNQLGFSETQIMALQELNTRELSELCDSSASFANVSINHKVFWNLVTLVQENTKQLNTIDRALVLGVSTEIIHERFGLSSAEVAARRKLIGVEEPLGRKPNANEEEEIKIWELWKLHQNPSIDMENSEAGFDILLLISEETGVSITEVWRLVSTWLKENR